MWLQFSLLNALFESFSNVFGKRGAQKVGAISTAWASRFFSLFILIPIVFLTKSFQDLNIVFWIALLIAACLNTVTSILFAKAIKDSPLSLALPITTFTPIFLLISSPIIVKEFPKPLGIIGIFLIVIGAYILNLSKRLHGAFEPILSIFKEKGTRLMFFIAFIWSISANIDKIAVKNSNPLLYSLTLNITLLVFLTIIVIIRRISIRNILNHSKILAPIGIANGISQIFQTIAISITIVPNAIAVKRTSSLFGVIWGRLIFKETNIRERLFGAAIMVLGVVLITLS